MDAYWRAANYLSVGHLYLVDNPLLKRPLELADVKPLAVLPILHLNGYKISNPTYLARTAPQVMKMPAPTDGERSARTLRIGAHDRFVVEQAKGLVAYRLDLTIDTAGNVLHGYADNHNQPLAHVVAAIIDHTLSTDELIPAADAAPDCSLVTDSGDEGHRI
jgi:hypothetical protein